MSRFVTRFCLLAAWAVVVGVGAVQAADEDGFMPIFDGKSLDGWDGNPAFWKVEDGTITGQTTAENPTKGNTFLIWRKGETADFELKLEYRIVGGNSGIQYRSFEVPNEKWVVGGYQGDFEAGDTYSGILYGERFRGILAGRGQKTVIGDDHKPKVVGSVGDSAEIQKKIKKEDWNEYHIVAKGFTFTHTINGVKTIEVTDEDMKDRRAKGILALQLHAGPPMKVQFRKIRIKQSAPAANKQSSVTPAAKGAALISLAPAGANQPRSIPVADAAAKKKVLFISGKPSHGYGAHEHYAGCLLLAKALNDSNVGVQADVIKHGWPTDASVFDGVSTVVMYSDGGGGHMVMPNLKQMDALAKKGVGVVCIHYAVEIPAGEPGNYFLDWIGGYFEMNWSVNPHWTGKFTKFPEHPITRGVKPFEIHDEWYYHMRFRPNMEGVTPILTDLPPDSTLSRPDGPHSGNVHVRAAVQTRKEAQHVAWASENKNGGRGFGFTGGHDHWNWGDPNFRKLMLNAIAWTAKIEVPANGVENAPVNLEQLEANQDFPQPQNFDREGVKKRLHLPEGNKTSAAPTGAKAPASVKPLFSSDVITTRTPGHAQKIEVDIKGSKQLFLVANDGGNGFGCDWADWAEPRLVGPKGELKLTDLKWKSATTDWGQVRVNANAGGDKLRIDGKDVAYGIGAHANSVIAYDLPEDYEKFVARVGIDNGGSEQQGGAASSVQFLVFNVTPPAIATAPNAAAAATRDPADAVSGLDVAEGLEAKLFAAEPQVLNLTNLDIDHRGRAWVCEVVNYRGHNGKRPEGDRILILEDTDHDGVADKSTVFYQGRDIDSAMGICVLGNKVIVSCSPNIWVFTDENGDDKPDRKELLFTKTGQPQHDHSAHSFLFGPDGKLYWNFGNTGQRVCDASGNVVIDKAGNEVVDNGKPYYGGMPFRCNLDGSQFEVLAHNFRNNYEVTVDSFGSLWQSDNDDDGNRGVRINYVMEFGNYGYRDELTGAGWQSPRTNMESEIPLRHWHLNDPGVMPNLVQTGAGSPTGITVYEGRLLPKPFWDQVIHCDAGPNVVRAYPATRSGAGYKGEMLNLVHGARDNWFRPADVCVAPDGSLFITDWYDPGVGGHAQGDSLRGRLFRVAPPGVKFETPKFDFTTAEGAVLALQNPNASVRYLAWTALHAMAAKAEPALIKLWKESDNPRQRARALWLLGKIPGRGEHYVNEAANDKDVDLRATSVRLARQLGVDLVPLARRLAKDESPAVRREVAIALRHHKAPEMPALWAELAAAHDGQDRWYLEALGISADKQWDKCLEAFLAKVGDRAASPAVRDVVWRSRAPQTATWLAKYIRAKDVPVGEVLRYFRAFDYQSGPAKDAALVELAFGGPTGEVERDRLIASEAIKRLPSFDIATNPNHAAALDRLLGQVKGTSQFVELVGKFQVTKRYPELLAIAQERPDEQVGVEAIQALLQRGQNSLVTEALNGKDVKSASATARALANSADGRSAGFVLPIVKDKERDLELRRQATRALASTKNGAEELVKLARDKQLDESLASAASFQLHAAPWPEIKGEAVKLFPLPPAKDRALPPIADLIKMKGDVTRGQAAFAKTAECAKCHVVNGQGKEVGPNLSEIGGKLSRQAFFESILYPSAGIAHSYETWSVVLESGNVVTGLKTSETPDSVTIKTADALVRTFPKSEVEELKRMNVSLMPADLQKTMTAQDLVDVVEYLTTLRKPGT